MKVLVLSKDLNTTYLDKLLKDEEGKLKVCPAALFKSVPQLDLAHWCTRNGVYQIPTQELVDWLKEKIADRPAIEICSGNGVLGRTLKIPATDSYLHMNPEMQVYYKLLRQEPTQPPPEVEKLDALDAVKKYKPEVVVGAYCTHWGLPPDKNASCYGVREDEILALIKMYVHIGNDDIHGRKPILAVPHEIYRFEWLAGRAFDPTKNNIRVWNR
jgi:hypothetical protein